MTNTNVKHATAEVVEYLKGIKREDVEKIPQKFLEFLYENALDENVPNIDYTKPLNELELSQDAKGIICYICYTYWCTTEEDKKRFSNILKQNEESYANEWKEKTENMFKSKNQSVKVEENTEEEINNLPIEQPQKQGIINKIITFIKNIFKRK